MSIRTLVKTSEYHDSVKLMLVARELTRQPNVRDAAVVMGTEANKSLLEQSGLLTPEAQAATPNDLVIAVACLDDSAMRSCQPSSCWPGGLKPPAAGWPVPRPCARP